MAGKTTHRRTTATPSTGLVEFRRRNARSMSSTYWGVAGIWGTALASLLFFAALGLRWSSRNAGTSAPLPVASAAPIATPAPAPPPKLDLPVIHLSHGATTNAGGNPAAASSRTGPRPVRSGGEMNPFVAEGSELPETEIDRLVSYRLTRLNIEPAPICSDAVFLRRVHLDLIGTLPTADEVRAFLDDSAPDKRERLIDELLERPEFADYWAMRWCDVLRVKAEFPINLWPNAAQAYHRWIRTALRDNWPYDRFARELLTASGSNFRTPQVNFYRAMQGRDPESIAKTVALTFMGERAEKWPAAELQNLTTFFSQVGYKATGEWKEQIVLFDPRSTKRSPDAGPLLLTLPDGRQVELPEGTDPRMAFADWLIDGDNPRFVRPVVNRVWGWLLGRGIVEPADDFRADNPPRNIELLDHLGREFVAAGFDVKQLCRLILNSATYQRACIPANTGATESAAEFASYPLRRLDAEVLIDAICQITGTTETYSSMIPEPFTFLPETQRAIALPDGSISSPFLEMFGRPARDTGLVDERNNRMTAAQALHLLNSNHIRQKLERGPGMQAMIDRAFAPDAIVEEFYLAILSRPPTTDERVRLMSGTLLEEGYFALAWALINSEEFLFRH